MVVNFIAEYLQWLQISLLRTYTNPHSLLYFSGAMILEFREKKKIILKLLLPKSYKVVLTIYIQYISQIPTLEVLSLIPRAYPPLYVDFKPRLVIPKLPLLSYKFIVFYRVMVGFWRLLVPSCCFLELKSHHIHALGLILKVSFVERKDKTIGERSTKSSIYKWL